MSSTYDFEGGFRRVLYDAMVLSTSLRAVRDGRGYPKPSDAEIDGAVEAHHMNALVQMRSMNDFFTDHKSKHDDTMMIGHFPGCPRQPNRLPLAPDPHRRFHHTYVAHKSWHAVAKDGAVGAAHLPKPEVVRMGLALLDGFDAFWTQCQSQQIGVKLNPYAVAYKKIYLDNVQYLRTIGP